MNFQFPLKSLIYGAPAHSGEKTKAIITIVIIIITKGPPRLTLERCRLSLRVLNAARLLQART